MRYEPHPRLSQAQLGDFEYFYTGSVRAPRWWLLMHQLVANVAPRRLIVEIHNEWGVGRSFYADVSEIRARYEAIGCTVTTATVLRHPLAWCAPPLVPSHTHMHQHALCGGNARTRTHAHARAHTHSHKHSDTL